MVTSKPSVSRDLFSALDRFTSCNSDLEFLEKRLVEFDAFSFLGVAVTEDVHSKVLAWLLNPRGSHGTGDCFLKKFLVETGSTTQEQLREADWSDTVVQREWHNEVDGSLGSLDILILNMGASFACAIENKIFSSEHSEQLTRYRRALSKEFEHFRKGYIFLSPNGMAARRHEERQYWIPVGYETILRLVEDLIGSGDGPDETAVGVFLTQYATTLRRRVVPSTDLRHMATKIYLRHKEAIDFIYAHRDSYVDVIERICREAIDLQENWRLVHQPPQKLVGFEHANWERFKSFHTGSGWSPQTDAVILFDFDLREMGAVNVILTIAPGDDETVRRRLFEMMRSRPELFNARGHRRENQYQERFIRVYVSETILSDTDFSNWDEEAARARIMQWVEDFASNEFLVMSQAITECLTELDGDIASEQPN